MGAQRPRPPGAKALGAKALGAQQWPRASSGVTHRTRGRTGPRGRGGAHRDAPTSRKDSKLRESLFSAGDARKDPGAVHAVGAPSWAPRPTATRSGPTAPDARSPSLSQSHPDYQGPTKWGTATCLWGAAGIWGADSRKGNSAPAHAMAPPHQISRRTDSQTGSTTSAREENVCHGPITCHHLEEQPMLGHEKTKAHPAAPGTGGSRWPVCSETNAQAPCPSVLPRPWPRPT